MAQVLLGIVTRVFINIKSKVAPISVIRKAHHFLGWCLNIAGLANAWIGWGMYVEDKNKFLTIIYVLLFIIYSLLESWGIVYLRITTVKTQVTTENERRILLNKPKGFNKIHKLIIKDNKPWVFYDELLLDVGGYVDSHPGGSQMLKAVYGEDVGKYLNGSSSLPQFNPNYHSAKAFTFAKTLSIGEVGFDRNILLGPYNQEKMEWEVIDNYKVCESTFCVVLRSDKWVVGEPEGTEWIGKLYLLTSDEIMLTRRYYSCVVSSIKDFNEPNSKNIRLYIKPYENGKVSKYATTRNIGEKITLKGPLDLD